MQISLSLALLILAGLFCKSLFNLNHADLGMKVDQVITFGISPLRNGYTQQRAFHLYEKMEEGLAALPGITSVTSSTVRVLGRSSWISEVLIDGHEIEPGEDRQTLYSNIGSGYFQTLGIPLIAGREFTRNDDANRRKAAVVNEAFATKFNLGPNAVGKYFSDGKKGWETKIEIVGLVRNTKYTRIARDWEPIFFLPYRQEDRVDQLTFYVRSSLNPDPVFLSIRKLLAKLDPNLPVENLCTMQQQVNRDLEKDRIMSILCAVFAALAVLLAVVGIYGVMAFTVAQRTSEIGLRIALGASQTQVRAMVLRRVGGMTIVGAAIGLVFGIGFGRIAQSMLYQIKGSDPLVFCGATLILVLISLIAGLLPARRASKIDPLQAMRYE
jgi:predicted permease